MPGRLQRLGDHLLRCAPRPRPGRARPTPAWGRSARAPSGRCETTFPPWSKIMKRVLVVPWSIAPAYCATSCPPIRVDSGQSAHVRAAHRDEEGARGRARVLVPGAALAEVARPALARHERDRGGARPPRPRPPRGRAPRRGRRPRRARPAGPRRPGGGRRAWSCRRARPCRGPARPRPPASKQSAHASGDSSARAPAAVPNCRKKVPYSGPLAPPTFEISVMRDRSS